MTRTRLFDAGVEEPDLLKADGRARRDRRRLPASPMIDPRIAARRAEVAAEAAASTSRRRRRLAVGGIVAMALGLVAALVLLSPVASVRTIEVRGAARTGGADVRAASGLASGSPLVRIDQDRVGQRILALPWVREVRLERRWPRTVVVAVVEREPAAVVPCAAGSCLVDAEGRILAPAADDPRAATALPRIVGVAASGRPGDAVPEASRGPLLVAVALPAALRPLVLGVRGEGGEVSLDLQAPGRQARPPVIRLGAPDRIRDKLTAAATVLARTSVNGVAVLDVRVPESPALTRLAR